MGLAHVSAWRTPPCPLQSSHQVGRPPTVMGREVVSYNQLSLSLVRNSPPSSVPGGAGGWVTGTTADGAWPVGAVPRVVTTILLLTAICWDPAV
eukprot:scaffold195812_cov27-Attheya_sp.AAC.1